MARGEPAMRIPRLALVLAVVWSLDRWLPGHHLVEEGAKFVGIAIWATWLIGTGVAVLARQPRMA